MSSDPYRKEAERGLQYEEVARPVVFHIFPYQNWTLTRNCLKCGGGNAWRRMEICAGRRGFPCRKLLCPDVEHFHVRCDTCTAKWLEAPKDNPKGNV